jgi:4,5-DOPA dioxygenase extradiol
MAGAPDTLPGVQSAPDFDAAVPTPDHFIPLLYLAGLAGAGGRPADVLVGGYTYGSLSMTAYTVDLGSAAPTVGQIGAAPGPPDAPSADSTTI